MRYPDLKVGEDYILDRPHRGALATFEGKHDGSLALADGSVFMGAGNFLRFRVKTPNGDRIVLLDNAAGVEESVKAKFAREAEAEAKRKREEAALKEVQDFLRALGFNAVQGYPFWQKIDEEDKLFIGRTGESADEIELDHVTIAKLKRLLEAAKQPAGRKK